MNYKALYQLERAIDALKQMAQILREENTTDSITFSSAVTGSRILGGMGDDHISLYGYDYTPLSTKNDVITFS